MRVGMSPRETRFPAAGIGVREDRSVGQLVSQDRSRRASNEDKQASPSCPLSLPLWECPVKKEAVSFPPDSHLRTSHTA